MAKVLTLKFIDGSWKENEVTGKDMGGEDLFFIPLSKLSLGRIKWDVDKYIYLHHFIDVLEVGDNYVELSVTSWQGTDWGTYKLYNGDKKRCSYYFGEWNYYFVVELLMKDEE